MNASPTSGDQGGAHVVSTLRVLIVDDNEDMLALIRGMVDVANPGLVVTAAAADGDEALRRWREERPDVVVLDQQMPGLSGLETAEVILREAPNQLVVLFTAFLEPGIEQAAKAIGVKTCVRKDDAWQVVLWLRECALA